MKINSFTLYTVFMQDIYKSFAPWWGLLMPSHTDKWHSVGGISALDQSNCEIVLFFLCGGKVQYFLLLLYVLLLSTFLTNAIIQSIQCMQKRKVNFLSEIFDCLFRFGRGCFVDLWMHRLVLYLLLKERMWHNNLPMQSSMYIFIHWHNKHSKMLIVL